eukprot:CAMPEP_0168404788 /NCGR_PEP_ID=MMETSP0228-20121227/24816_1 /TAXON_ID=133427 /ORGANISM="Protoceratium reticulatum, Strain CCCM 535 (=CCMP 1889)" /LENGTH=265 /DNA_ID=CAMNT_0008418415 /DNA_START=1 /DNA_END=798 /DNA_ORIENTATION=+
MATLLSQSAPTSTAARGTSSHAGFGPEELKELKDMSEGQTLLRLLRPAPDHELPEVFRTVRRDGLHVRPRALHREAQDLRALIVLERDFSADDLEEDHGIGVDVSHLVVCTLEDLRGHPVAGAGSLCHLLPLGVKVLHARRAEVRDLHQRDVRLRGHILVKEQVQGLQIPMDDLGLKGVQVVHAFRDVAAHLELLAPGQHNVLGVVQELEERAARAELRDHAHGPLLEADPIEPHEVHMADLIQDRHLSREGDLLFQLLLGVLAL